MLDNTDTTSSTASRPIFPTIMCGVDGTPASLEAIRQAAVLAGSDSRLRLATIRWESEAGVHRRDVDQVLERGAEVARAHGVEPETGSELAVDPAGGLLAMAAGVDLLVVGDHDRPHGNGIAIGSTALTLVQRSPVSVLVARHPWVKATFPGSILVAGHGDQTVAAEIAAHLAAAHGCPVVRIEPEDQVALPASIARIASREGGAGLVVTSGPALPSSTVRPTVAEQLAAAAPCSVLVARTRTRSAEA